MRKSRKILRNQLFVVLLQANQFVDVRMLYRVIVNNYKSFGEEQQFDMFPNTRRDNFPNHILRGGNLPVLKECAIYGANGSGKSNFIELFSFLRIFVTKGVFDAQSLQEWYATNRFRLPVAEGNQPIEIMLEYGIGDAVFIYVLKITPDGIKEESLYRSGAGRGNNQLLFSRTVSDVNFEFSISEDIRNVFLRQINANPAATILGLNGKLHLLDFDVLNKSYQWFESNLTVVSISRDIPWLIEYFASNPKVLDFVNTVYSEIGLGIDSLSIQETDVNDWFENNKRERDLLTSMYKGDISQHSISKVKDTTPAYSVLKQKDGKQVVLEFIFKQLGKGGYRGDMRVTDQSTGTCRLLTLLPAIYDAINRECVVLIDEIDNGIHPMLIRKLIEYFGKRGLKGQLIYTTHETALLDQQNLLRADEVWLTEKVQGCTKMYSLNMFKIHKTISIQNGYLEGRYGAIPFLNSIE